MAKSVLKYSSDFTDILANRVAEYKALAQEAAAKCSTELAALATPPPKDLQLLHAALDERARRENIAKSLKYIGLDRDGKPLSEFIYVNWRVIFRVEKSATESVCTAIGLERVNDEDKHKPVLRLLGD
jgi:hypothetical protein